ncbi:MAG TPA: hypothetical protein VN426_06600 [Syntrophomonadaceae bacterium]|nr:hypothetical protein [Syntrophomonadaceae bacterium]
MGFWQKVLLLLIVISISLFAKPAWAGSDASELFQSLSSAPTEVQDAFTQVTRDFALYEQFLQSEPGPDGSCILVQAQTPDQARSFLEGGFTFDLADAICSNYTCWDSVQQRLLLIPQEGLPTLHPDDKSLIAFHQLNPDEIIFRCIYPNCYASQDAYVYSVKALCQNSIWKIDALSLEKADCEN